MLAVCVDFEIEPARLDEFMPIMRRNAAASLANEAGCHQFDITQNPQTPSKIFLYGLYDDTAAFELHKQSDHYLEFNAACDGMIVAKSVRLLARIEPDPRI